MNTSNNNDALNHYPVWDRSVRIFHWLNVICIIGLMGVGLVILYNKDLGVSPDGKILLKTIHVYIGYVFAINLIWRIIWMFSGNRYSSWRAILPFGKKYIAALKSFVNGLRDGSSANYLGHNPVAKLMVAFLFLLLSTQAVTGLVLAGTDLYFPPFGNTIAEWVVAPDTDNSNLEKLKPGSKEFVDPAAYNDMRSFRKPFITTHKYVFYTLLFAIFFHIAGVVFSELRERSGLISAMFTGIKTFSIKPVDSDSE